MVKLDFTSGKVRHVYASVDWGFTHAGVIQVWVADNDGRLYMVHEVARSQKTIEWWIAKAKSLQHYFHIERFYCDPAEPMFIEQFIRAGLPAVKAVNDIEPGVQALKVRLKVQGDGQPRLMVFADALEKKDPILSEQRKPCGFLEEITSYEWDHKQTGTQTLKEVPIKENDDSMDCARYMIFTLDGARDKKVRVWE